MLVIMTRNFNASLERMNEKIEKSTQEIAQTNQRVETLSTQVVGEGRIINNEQPRGIMRNFPIDNDRDLKLLELPEFTGDGDAEDFLDWVRQMERSLTKKNLRAKRLREDEPRINTWRKRGDEDWTINKRVDTFDFSQGGNIKLCVLDDVLRLAERFEKQEKEKKTSNFKERKSFFNGEGSYINSNNSNN
uniref:Uncharacterized protein n=1 Tax=Chenopodium quinoa TaxID=63459 RepID=A0A803MN32_CHEQI